MMTNQIEMVQTFKKSISYFQRRQQSTKENYEGGVFTSLGVQSIFISHKKIDFVECHFTFPRTTTLFQVFRYSSPRENTLFL